MPSKAVFLDRDNTIIDDPGYISDPGQVKLLPGAAAAMRRLSEAGYKLVLVTNQSGIARGMFTEETLAEIHKELVRQLAAAGARLDAIYFSPYHPEGIVERYARATDCRKPLPGMLLQAAKDLDIDLCASWMIGDSPSDIAAGKAAGCRTILIRHGDPTTPAKAPEPNHIAGDLGAAVDTVLSMEGI